MKQYVSYDIRWNKPCLFSHDKKKWSEVSTKNLHWLIGVNRYQFWIEIVWEETWEEILFLFISLFND